MGRFFGAKERTENLKAEFKVKEISAEDIARAIYSTEDKWSALIPLCSRTHDEYINKSATWKMFEEREAKWLEEKKFED